MGQQSHMRDDLGLEEERVQSDYAFRGRLVHLRIDTVRLPSGRTTTREVVEHPGAVAVVPLHDDGTVSLVRQWRQPAGKVLLEIPAGTLEHGEDPLDCACRELAEEVGVTAGRMVHLFSSYLAPGYSSELLHTYLALELGPACARPDADEAIAVVRMPLAGATSAVLDGTIQDAKTVCGLLLAERCVREGLPGSRAGGVGRACPPACE